MLNYIPQAQAILKLCSKVCLMFVVNFYYEKKIEHKKM